MIKFLRKLFAPAKQAEIAEKSPAKVDYTGWRERKNVMRTIQRKTGRSYDEIRECLYGDGGCWAARRKKGSRRWFYEPETAKAMVDWCVMRLGKKKRDGKNN